MIKQCRNCKKLKNIYKFYKNKNTKDGYDYWCKHCRQLYMAKWKRKKINYIAPYLKNNPNYMKEYYQEYKIKYPERIKEKYRKFKEKFPNYREPSKKPVYRRVYLSLKRKNNPLFRLNSNMSIGIAKSIRNNKGGHWEHIVGYTLEQLREHLEELFLPKMTWENYGKWHVHHIIPISKWKYENVNDSEFKQCWARANLEPLWAIDNMRKGNKI